MPYNYGVPPRPTRNDFFSAFDDFERTIDALFDDLLIARWRGPEQRAADAFARVIDFGDRYEVSFAQFGAPGELEIEVTERRLVVRSAGDARRFERAVELPHPVETEGATAEFSGSELKIVLPKQRARKISVN